MSIPLWLWMCEGRDRCRCATDLGISLAWSCCTTNDAVCMYEVRSTCKTHSLVRTIDPMLPIHTFWKALPYDRVREAKSAMSGTLRTGRHSVKSEAISASSTCRPQPSCTAKSTVLRTPARIRMEPFIAWHTFLYGQAHRDDHSGRVKEPLIVPV
jgi:hypothetical protein